jgi:signal transduction histidine kinase
VAHDLIQRIQSRVIAEQDKVVEFGDTIRGRLVLVLAFALSAAVLVGVLALTLVRRWVLIPVAALRAAAQRIAGGDFDHRTPVTGHDELAQLSSEVNHMAGMVRMMLDERVERERLAAVGEMVRRLAHNLRNPLSGIRGLAELSREETAPGTHVHENQNRIILSVDRFEKWLADLLSLHSRIPPPHGRREECSARVERRSGAASGVVRSPAS